MISYDFVLFHIFTFSHFLVPEVSGSLSELFLKKKVVLLAHLGVFRLVSY